MSRYKHEHKNQAFQHNDVTQTLIFFYLLEHTSLVNCVYHYLERKNFCKLGALQYQQRKSESEHE
mgnify:CR=1